MALSKLFQRIFWHNNTTPAINEDNLNAMSRAIDDIDNRVIELGTDVIEKVPELEEMAEQLEEGITNPPYIGANGDWYIWNTTTQSYVDSGVDASISVQIADITMLEPTQNPYVTNTGTNTDPIFHLFIPRGEKGEAGGMAIDGANAADLVSFPNAFVHGNNVVANGNYSHAEGENSSISKTVTLIDEAMGKPTDRAQEIIEYRLRFYGIKPSDGITFYVNNTLVWNGTAGNIPTVVHGQDEYYRVELDSNVLISTKSLGIYVYSLQATTTQTIPVELKLVTKTNAVGNGAHSEGYNTLAAADYSHAEGIDTIAIRNGQHVSGKYNNYKTDTLFEVGNGDENARSNAFEVYENGDVNVNGNIKRNGNNIIYNVSMDSTGTASATSIRYQRILIDGNEAAIVAGSRYMEQSITLSTSNEVTATFTNSAITNSSAIEVMTSDPNLGYKTMNIADGTCTVTFDKQSSASTVTVRIYIK